MRSQRFGQKRGQELLGTVATSGRNMIPQIAQELGCAIVPPEAKFADTLPGDFEAMAKR